MANIKSAIKRAKVSTVKNLRNRMVKSSIKTALKRFDMAIESGDVETAKALLSKTVSKVDRGVAQGALHKNAANRKKAQLATKLAKAQ